MAKKVNRRGAGEGAVFQRKDGRWCASIDLGWQEGRRRKSYYGTTQEDVQAKLLKAGSDHSQGLPVAVERQTVEQFMDDWLEHTLKSRAKPRSFESFSTIARL